MIEVAKKVSSAIVAVSLLAGTAAGQKKNERPPVSVPNEFRGAEISVPTDQTSIGDLKWFEIFKDDELQKMVRTARVQNYASTGQHNGINRRANASHALE